MNAARVVPDPAVAARVHARRIVACVLALSLITGGIHSARAAGDGDTSESRVGVVMAVVCGFALKLAIPAPVPWVGVAAAACTFAFLDALGSPD